MAKERKLIDSLRIWLTAFCWLGVFVSTAIAARKVQQFVSTDPQFTLSADRSDTIRIAGVRYASQSRVARVFSSDLGRSISLLPLAERRRRLLGIDWVEDASISRIWPDRVLVRITERKPVAFVNLPLAENARISRMALIDREGVFLDPPPSSHFTFPVVEGISEQQPEAERKVRIRAMQRLLNELGPIGRDISEIQVGNLDDLRIVTLAEGRTVELEMGDGGYLRRYQNFMNHFPEIRRRTPGATSFDLRLDDRIITKE